MQNILTLKEILNVKDKRYAVGSFSPRYLGCIKPILEGAQECNSPVIVQISQKELGLFELTPKEFSDKFYELVNELNISIPVCLHLDHTMDISILKNAVDNNFKSVMCDASKYPFDKNVELTKDAVDYAHSKGASVEAELGRIGTTDFVESDDDVNLYTDPDEAKKFVELTNCDALAVSVGTAHGVYSTVQPKVDLERLNSIGELTDIKLVLHGGSGVPSTMVSNAVKLEKGNIVKVNIATDLELALLNAIDMDRMTSRELDEISPDLLEKGQEAVKNIVKDKITNYLGSNGQATNEQYR